ncbi:MAG: DNA repair protein RadC [Acidobacteria bacterium]|nr:DNA repair protein RadC [Acidobacteriota bacterium]
MKQIALHDRPREKMARVGPTALGDNELIALLVGSGTRSKSALMLASDVLNLAGGATGLMRLGLDELTTLDGVGISRAARVLAAIELGRRVLAGRTPERPKLGTPREVGNYLLPLYGGYRVERFGLVLLDAKHRLIRTTILSVGSLDASIAHPREVFREAALASASAIVLFHNHPSGDPQPSAEDVLLTRRLVSAGQVMGIDVVDHLILGESRWFSFKDAARL